MTVVEVTSFALAVTFIGVQDFVGVVTFVGGAIVIFDVTTLLEPSGLLLMS